jgi:DNA-binding LacI/PurR family transcriptional regulator
MREIAKLAGVSVWTVSMALRNHAGVSEETRKRVKAIAEEYHYLPNRLSQGTISGCSGLLGYITHRDIGPGYTNILQGALYQAYLEGFHMLVLQTSKEDASHLSHAVRDLLELRVEGIAIVSAQSEPLPNELLLTIRSAGAIPVGVMETTFASPIDRVNVDYEAALALQVDYLRRLGHRRIGAIMYESQRWEEQAAGLKHLLAHYGLTLCGLHRVSSANMAEMAFEGIMASEPQPTALMVALDMWAWPLLRRAALCGLRVPEDLSIVSAGNYYRGALFPELSTVDLHFYQTGREAISLIRRRLREGHPSAEIIPETLTVQPELVTRGTCSRVAVKV